MAYEIRTYGDPVLKSTALEIQKIDDKLVRLTDEMFDIMYDAPGIGLAAPQIGVQKKLFVYDIGDGADVLINPEIVESSGEWVYEEGCLSIPGLYVEMVRPKEVLLKGINLEGEEITVEADELLSRLFQHELDHLNGVLMFDRMTPEQRVEAMAEYRRLHETESKPRKPAEPRVIKLK
ncbi:MAG: peptide deformylase [Actinomycetota bacterium]|jgi:peptide deformylase